MDFLNITHGIDISFSWQYNMSILFKKQNPDHLTSSPRGPLGRAWLEPSRGWSGGTNVDTRLVGSTPLQALLPPLCSWRKLTASFLGPRALPGSGRDRSRGPWTCSASWQPGPVWPSAPDPGRQAAVHLGMELMTRRHALRPVSQFPYTAM